MPRTQHPPLRALPRLGRATLLAATVALAGCSAMQAQNPGGALRPVNAVAAEDGRPLMLQGHDVVAYFTEQRHRPGLAQHQVVHEGVVFRFASAEHQRLFQAEPGRYLPQYGGYCANGIAYGIPWGGNADAWLLHQGKLYIFGGAGSKAGFMLDVPGNTALADRYWRDEIAGRNSWLQRARRLVLRVPHYKSDAELAAQVAAAARAPGAGTAPAGPASLPR